MHTTHIFLVAMIIILTVPYAIWRLGRTEYFAPLVVVQIVTGILLGPGALGAVFPQYYALVFNAEVTQSLNGIAWWSVMVFVLLAGVELDLREVWIARRETAITAGLALVVPLLFGSVAAMAALRVPGWQGSKAMPWQFVIGVGMSCAVTALPILILFMEKTGILGSPVGQRILRYASLDDIAIWAVLACILMDWRRVGLQLSFLVAFLVIAIGYRRLMRALAERDRWYLALIWLSVCGFAADYCGLHFMVGSFLAGASTDKQWFNSDSLVSLRNNVLLVLMPVFFLSTGLRTHWIMQGVQVIAFALVLLGASIAGKLLGVRFAAFLLRWPPGESGVIGWLLQTKALIMIIFANILLDKNIITESTFTSLLLMAVGSTMLTVPVVVPLLSRLHRLPTPSRTT